MKKVFSLILCLATIVSLVLPVSALKSIAVKGIKLDKSTITMEEGNVSYLKVTFTPTNTTQNRLAFSTNNKNVVTVDANGKITAVKTGSAIITVVSTSNKNVIAKCKVTVSPAKVKIDLNGKLKNPTITWLGHWPQNSETIGEPVRPEMKLFKEKFGGKVKDIVVPWDQISIRLATLVMSGDAPDLFVNDAAFPNDINKGLFEPIDGLIDYAKDPLWSPLKSVADQYVWKGKHYKPVFNSMVWLALFYNPDILQSKGIEDPRELYYKGQWDWNKFMEISKKVTEDTNKDGKNDVFALAGYPTEECTRSTGKPYIGISADGHIVNNIKDPDIARAMNFLGDLAKAGVADMNTDNIEGKFNAGQDVFYAAGVWGYGIINPKTKKVYPFVPFPKDPMSKKYYAEADSDGFYIPKGAKNIQGAVAYLTCKRIAITDPALVAAQKKLYKENGWSDEDLKMFYDNLGNPSKLVPVYEFQNGFGSTVSNFVWGMINATYRDNKPWATARDEFYQKFEDGINYVIGKSNR